MALALRVTELAVRSLDVDFNVVSWKTNDTTGEVFDYQFRVLRSEGPEGPFVEVSQPLEDQYMFVDRAIPGNHDLRELYYKVRVTRKRDSLSVDSEGASRGADADLIATEIRKQMNLLFREFIGRRCWVLPVRTFGPRCQDCWSKTLQKRTKTQCVSCFDTGFFRGYYTPIESWVSIDPSPKARQHTSVGPLQQSDTTGRMGYWPPLKPGDLIIEPENVRWRVVQGSATEQLRAPLHQEFQIHKIPNSDMEYRIPLDPGAALEDLWLSPARNFSNPHSLVSFTNEEYPGVLQLYSTSYPEVKS